MDWQVADTHHQHIYPCLCLQRAHLCTVQMTTVLGSPEVLEVTNATCFSLQLMTRDEEGKGMGGKVRREVKAGDSKHPVHASTSPGPFHSHLE